MDGQKRHDLRTVISALDGPCARMPRTCPCRVLAVATFLAFAAAAPVNVQQQASLVSLDEDASQNCVCQSDCSCGGVDRVMTCMQPCAETNAKLHAACLDLALQCSLAVSIECHTSAQGVQWACLGYDGQLPQQALATATATTKLADTEDSEKEPSLGDVKKAIDQGKLQKPKHKSEEEAQSTKVKMAGDLRSS